MVRDGRGRWESEGGFATWGAWQTLCATCHAGDAGAPPLPALTRGLRLQTGMPRIWGSVCVAAPPLPHLGGAAGAFAWEERRGRETSSFLFSCFPPTCVPIVENESPPYALERGVRYKHESDFVCGRPPDRCIQPKQSSCGQLERTPVSAPRSFFSWLILTKRKVLLEVSFFLVHSD